MAPHYPNATWQPSPNYTPSHQGRKAVVLHIAQGGYQSSIDYMRGAGVSSHFIISTAGGVAQLVDLDHSAWANGLHWVGERAQLPQGYPWLGPGWYCPHEHKVTPTWESITPGINPNLQTISIEHAGFTSKAVPAIQRAALIQLLRWLGRQYPELLPWVPGRTLIRHADIDPVDKAFCPGTGFDMATIADAANVPLPPAEAWQRVWARRGIDLPAHQIGWAIPQLYKYHFTELGACVESEHYLANGQVSVAVFEHGLIYFLKSTGRAYLGPSFVQPIGASDVA